LRKKGQRFDTQFTKKRRIIKKIGKKKEES